MAHQYELHRPVNVPCWCCRRPESFTFKSRSDQVVCPGCLRHLGDTPSRLKQCDLDHSKWWEQDFKAMRERHREAVQGVELRRQREVAVLEDEAKGLREKVTALEAAMLRDLESRPLESIAVWFEQTKIAEADERTKQARNHITHLYRVLWHVDDVHHESEEDRDRCTCGEKLDSCATYRAMEAIRGRLYKWETEEIGRMKKGWSHSLPDDHPDVKRHEPWREQRGA